MEKSRKREEGYEEKRRHAEAAHQTRALYVVSWKCGMMRKTLNWRVSAGGIVVMLVKTHSTGGLTSSALVSKKRSTSSLWEI